MCPIRGNLRQKTIFFYAFRKLVHILFCTVQNLWYLCTKFSKLCNEFNTKFQLVY